MWKSFNLPNKLGHRGVLGILLIAGFISRIGLSLVIAESAIWPDSTYYLTNAANILSGDGYDPVYRRGPAYAYSIAVLFRILPNTVTTIQIAQAILWIIITLIYYFICTVLFQKKRIAVIAASFMSFHPLLIYISGVVLSETLFVFTYTLTLLGLHLYQRTGTRFAYLAFLSGFLGGVTCLVRSTAFIFLPLMAIWLILFDHKHVTRKIAHFFAFAVGCALVLVPYLITLHDSLGTWSLSGYGTRFLWQCTVYPLYGPVANVIENPNNMTSDQKAKVMRYTPLIGEGDNDQTHNRVYRKALLKYIRENPKEYFFKLIGKFLNNFRLVVQTDTKRAYEGRLLFKIVIFLSLSICYLFFFVGLLLIGSDPIKIFPLLAVLFGSLSVFTIYHSQVRYTLSIFPVLILFSSYGVNFAFEKAQKIFNKKIFYS